MRVNQAELKCLLCFVLDYVGEGVTKRQSAIPHPEKDSRSLSESDDVSQHTNKGPIKQRSQKKLSLDCDHRYTVLNEGGKRIK